MSYQPTPMSPLVGSSARLGRNWLDPGGSLLTWIGALQVAPPSSEKRRKILVSTVSRRRDGRGIRVDQIKPTVVAARAIPDEIGFAAHAARIRRYLRGADPAAEVDGRNLHRGGSGEGVDRAESRPDRARQRSQRRRRPGPAA